ncbi:hypothetical protein [Mycolicibacterium septicum]|uniref:hypothetical protein n=1 Tax=Mycolicibacterium septicum TaxID=98668 RepID=UPI001F47B102|nr:hypothetical protein [Mycolicibacterium septicum]
MYEFTLIVDHDPTEYSDELFEVAEGQLIPEGGAGDNLVHVYSGADSFTAAVIQAIHEIESVGLAVVGIASDDLVSLKDVAGRTERTYESMRLLAAGKRGPGGFPAPMSTGQWSLYSWAEVSTWLARAYGTDTPSEYDCNLAAADHLIRARRILASADRRQQLRELVTA